MDFIQKVTMIGALWECLFLNTILARAFYKIADFEIISVFEFFLCHQFAGFCLPFKVEVWIFESLPLSQSSKYHKSKFVLKTDGIRPSWHRLSPRVPVWDKTPL